MRFNENKHYCNLHCVNSTVHTRLAFALMIMVCFIPQDQKLGIITTRSEITIRKCPSITTNIGFNGNSH